MREKDEDKKSYHFYIIIGILAGSLVLILVLGVPWATIFPPATVTPTEANSSVLMTDWTSRENLGKLCPFDFYGDKGEITDIDERYDLTFYELIDTNVMPDDFNEDLSEYDYIMIRVNPDESTDGFWTTYDYFYPNLGNNFIFDMYAYHEATDLYGNVLDVVGGDEWDLASDGNYTIPLWFPPQTFTEYHLGRHFAIEDDIDDLSAKTLARIQNERWYRCMPTLYTLTDDTCTHGLSGEYEWITETFAIEFVFNETISMTDGEVTQVNFTSTCDYDHLLEYDNNTLYFVTTESWKTYYSNFEMFFEVSLGANISVSTIKAGRVTIPGRFFGTDYTFASSQTLASA